MNIRNMEQWTCKYCERECSFAEGGADDLPDGCDECWVIADSVRTQTFDFSFLADVYPVLIGGCSDQTS